MDIIPILQKELEYEGKVTRRMLERVPADKFDWQPHHKNMTLRQLSSHVAELPGWITMGLNTTELDFATAPYTQPPINTNEELLAFFEKSLEQGRASLAAAKEEDLQPSWTLRTGDKVHAVMTKYELIRHALSQISHHRAQLGLYLRLLDIPIPGSYGPSADETEMKL